MGSSTKLGARLATRPLRLQPRTARQTNAQALTGQIPALWRSLSETQRQGWQRIAPPGQSAYALFVANNRNLLTAGAPPATDPPFEVPVLPPILWFDVQPVYDDPLSPTELLGFTLGYQVLTSGSLAGVFRATSVLSKAKANVRASDVRVIASLNPLPQDSTTLPVEWQRVYGRFGGIGRVTFLFNLVDIWTGFASPAVRAFADLRVNAGAFPIAQTLIIEVDSEDVAAVPSSAVSVDGTPIAASN